MKPRTLSRTRVVEHLAGYGHQDLVVPEEAFQGDVGRANRAAGLWGLEVNGRVHTEIQAEPVERLQEERQVLRPLPSLRAVLRGAELRKVDRLQTVRFAGLGHSAVAAGFRVRYFTAADLLATLYLGLADNSVGRVIDSLLRADLVIGDELGFAPLDTIGGQLLFRFVAAPYERRSLGLASQWPFNDWGRVLPDHATSVSMLDRLLHHAVVVVTEGESFRMRGAKNRGALLTAARPLRRREEVLAEG